MNASVRERQREERQRLFREPVKAGSLKIRKATAAEAARMEGQVMRTTWEVSKGFVYAFAVAR